MIRIWNKAENKPFERECFLSTKGDVFYENEMDGELTKLAPESYRIDLQSPYSDIYGNKLFSGDKVIQAFNHERFPTIEYILIYENGIWEIKGEAHGKTNILESKKWDTAALIKKD